MSSMPLLADLQPLERRVLHEQVLEQLLAGLRSGQLRPGERLLEVEIAARLGLSRGTVREAIRRLEQDGLVVSQPHRGTFVVQLTAADVAEVYSLRLQLESYAVRLIGDRLSSATLDELTELVTAMSEAADTGDQATHLRHDQRFHSRLCQLSGHRHLYETWSRLALKLWLVNHNLQPIFDTIPTRSRERALGHLEVIDLLRQGETAAAAAWIERHISRRAHEVVARLATLENDQAPPDSRVLDLAAGMGT